VSKSKEIQEATLPQSLRGRKGKKKGGRKNDRRTEMEGNVSNNLFGMAFPPLLKP